MIDLTKSIQKVQLMGILNLTPDSFSDGGQLRKPEIFMQKAEQMLINGATILDLGAEASGPNSIDISADEELKRLLSNLKLLTQLKTKYQFQISIDTYKAKTAAICIENGADIINDITALRQDPQMAETLAKTTCPIILMYSKDSSPRTTATATEYQDVMQTIINFFEERISYAENQGIDPSRLILDPGMGAFISSIPDYSYQILNELPRLKKHFNLPILIGTSRKSMHPFPLQDRLIPSVITATFGAASCASILRVHDVKEHAQALKTWQLITENQ